MVKHNIAPVQTGELEKSNDAESKEEFGDENKKSTTHKFYLKFWGLQKYFANPASTLFSEEKDSQML